MRERKKRTYLFLVDPDNRVDTIFYAEDLPYLTRHALAAALRINPNLGEKTRRAIACLEMRKFYVMSPSIYVLESEVQMSRDDLQALIDQHLAAGTLETFLSEARLRR